MRFITLQEWHTLPNLATLKTSTIDPFLKLVHIQLHELDLPNKVNTPSIKLIHHHDEKDNCNTQGTVLSAAAAVLFEQVPGLTN